jgi:hypothetical protein
MWGGKKRMTADVFMRAQIVLALEGLIQRWEIESSHLSWCLVEPPDQLITEVLLWQ